jgi:5'-nucleotidase / UDP-sugar diphosphatase
MVALSALAKLRNPGVLRIVAQDAEFLQALAPFEQLYEQETSKVIGKLAKDQSLCLIRVPGSANRGTTVCADVVERAGGSDVSQVVAEAYRLAPDNGPADVGLVNAGGVRVPLETDGTQDLVLTQGTAYTLQPLPNELYIANLRGAQILDTLEEAVSNWKDSGNSDGSHPYASGLRWHLDLTKPKGQRFSQVDRKDYDSGQWQPLDLQATYSVVMTDYLAQGFEGYKTAGEACRTANTPQCMTAGGTFADESFVRYVTDRQAKGQALMRPACSDYSHQKVTLSDSRELKPCE